MNDNQITEFKKYLQDLEALESLEDFDNEDRAYDVGLEPLGEDESISDMVA